MTNRQNTIQAINNNAKQLDFSAKPCEYHNDQIKQTETIDYNSTRLAVLGVLYQEFEQNTA